MFIKCGIFLGAVSPLVAETAPAPASNNNIRFVLPGGLSCLSDSLSQTLVGNESERNIREKLDKDLQSYISAADSHLASLQDEARVEAEKKKKERQDRGEVEVEEEVEIAPKDPLDFWFAQVGASCFVSDLFIYFFNLRRAPKITTLIFLSMHRTFVPVHLRQCPVKGCFRCQDVCQVTGLRQSNQKTSKTGSWSRPTSLSRPILFASVVKILKNLLFENKHSSFDFFISSYIQTR